MLKSILLSFVILTNTAFALDDARFYTEEYLNKASKASLETTNRQAAKLYVFTSVLKEKLKLKDIRISPDIDQVYNQERKEILGNLHYLLEGTRYTASVGLGVFTSAAVVYVTADATVVASSFLASLGFKLPAMATASSIATINTVDKLAALPLMNRFRVFAIPMVASSASLAAVSFADRKVDQQAVEAIIDEQPKTAEKVEQVVAQVAVVYDLDLAQEELLKQGLKEEIVRAAVEGSLTRNFVTLDVLKVMKDLGMVDSTQVKATRELDKTMSQVLERVKVTDQTSQDLNILGHNVVMITELGKALQAVLAEKELDAQTRGLIESRLADAKKVLKQVNENFNLD